MKKIAMKKQYIAIILRKILAGVLVGVFVFTNTLREGITFSPGPAKNDKLAVELRTLRSEFKELYKATAICHLIEKEGNLDNGFFIQYILDKLETIKGSFENVHFTILPYEIIIEILDEDMAVRYFDPTKANAITPYSNVCKLSTKIIGSKLNRQVIHRVKALPASPQQKTAEGDDDDISDTPRLQELLCEHPPKLLVFDLDDTLADSNAPIHDDILKILLSLLSQKIHIAVVTSKDTENVLSRLPLEKIPDWLREGLHILALNGAEVSSFNEKGECTTILITRLTDRQVAIITQIIRNVGQQFGMEEVDDASRKVGFSIIRRKAGIIMGHLNALAPEDKYHIAQQIDLNLKRIDNQLSVLRSEGTIGVTLVPKGPVVCSLLKKLDIKPDRVVVFGDSLNYYGNDEDMLMLPDVISVYVGKEETLSRASDKWIAKTVQKGPLGTKKVLELIAKNILQMQIDQYEETVNKHKGELLEKAFDREAYHAISREMEQIRDVLEKGERAVKISASLREQIRCLTLSIKELLILAAYFRKHSPISQEKIQTGRSFCIPYKAGVQYAPMPGVVFHQNPLHAFEYLPQALAVSYAVNFPQAEQHFHSHPATERTISLAEQSTLEYKIHDKIIALQVYYGDLLDIPAGIPHRIVNRQKDQISPDLTVKGPSLQIVKEYELLRDGSLSDVTVRRSEHIRHGLGIDEVRHKDYGPLDRSLRVGADNIVVLQEGHILTEGQVYVDVRNITFSLRAPPMEFKFSPLYEDIQALIIYPWGSGIKNKWRCSTGDEKRFIEEQGKLIEMGISVRYDDGSIDDIKAHGGDIVILNGKKRQILSFVIENIGPVASTVLITEPSKKQFVNESARIPVLYDKSHIAAIYNQLKEYQGQFENGLPPTAVSDHRLQELLQKAKANLRALSLTENVANDVVGRLFLPKSDESRIKLKSEIIDIINPLSPIGQEEIIGITDRNIAEAIGLFHRTSNLVLLSPRGEVIIQQRAGFKSFGEHWTFFGGHADSFAGEVGAEECYLRGGVKEFLEESGIYTEGEITDSLKIEIEKRLVPIGIPGEYIYDVPQENNKERRALYALVLTKDENERLHKKSEELAALREKVGNNAEAIKNEFERRNNIPGEEGKWEVMDIRWERPEFLENWTQAVDRKFTPDLFLYFLQRESVQKQIEKVALRQILTEALPAAIDLVQEAGGIVKQFRREIKKGQFAVERKADKTVVTEADIAVQNMVLERLAQKFPDHRFVGEEAELSAIVMAANERNKNSPFVWVIDPIDGTKEFINPESNFFGVTLGLLYQGKPLLAVFSAPEYMINDREGALFVASELNEGVLLNGEPAHIRPINNISEERVVIASQTNREQFHFEYFQGIDVGSRATTLVCAIIAAGDKIKGPVGYIHPKAKVWDAIFAGYFVEKAGGVFITPEGKPILPVDRSILNESGILPPLLAGNKEAVDILMFGSLLTAMALAENPKGLVFYSEISKDMYVRAEVFKANLKRTLTEYPDELFFMGIENGIGESQKAQIMPIYKAVDEIRDMKDASGKPLFPNLMVKREKAGKLAKMVYDLSREGKLNLNNAFIGARKVSVDNKAYDTIKGEGRAWISAIDDSMSGDYLPVFEAIALNMMAYLNADISAIKNFYDAISDRPIDPRVLQDMIRNRLIYILPKATAFDTKQLRELYELARKVYIAA